MGDSGDYWNDLKSHMEAEKQRKIKRFYDKVMPKIKEYVAKYSDTLVLEEKSSNHYQVKNLDTGDLVNIWHTRAMQRKSGEVMGLGYKEENLWRELENVLKER